MNVCVCVFLKEVVEVVMEEEEEEEEEEVGWDGLGWVGGSF